MVLISGNGSNLQAVIDAINAGRINAEIALVVVNRSNAFGLERAKLAGIPTLIKILKPYKDKGKTRLEYDIDLSHEIIALVGQPTIQILAGFMHILSAEYLNAFTGPVINLHPALPGCFDGARAIERALEAFKAGLIQNTGVMVHFVIPAVDRGEPILQQVILVLRQNVPIYAEDTLQDLEKRIHSIEHELLVEGTIKVLG